MISAMDGVVVLTATISPPAGVPKLRRVDPAQRLDDYIAALQFYIRLPARSVSRIVFVENSNSDLSTLSALAEKEGAADRVEFISFNGIDHPPYFGRGYGEFKLLDYAMDHSNTLTNLADDQPVWKATGRYSVTNLPKLMSTAPTKFDLYCDTRTWPIPWMDLRVFAFSTRGYRRYLYGIYSQLAEHVIQKSPEEYLWPLAQKWSVEPEVVCRFRIEPDVDGIRGLDQQNYTQGKNRLKFWARSINRRIVEPVRSTFAFRRATMPVNDHDELTANPSKLH